jgi:hypothetical protein
MTRAHVIGIGIHPFGKFPDKTVPELARDAIWGAIGDAEIDPRRLGVA